MIHAYPDYYLDDAQREMGAMLDYAVNICGEDLSEFYSRFLVSGIAHWVSVANPKHMGMSGVELAMLVAEETGRTLPEKDPLIFVGSPEYWTGWILAYISWYLNVGFEILERRGVTVEFVCNHYHPYHEADVSKMVEIAQNRLAEYSAAENPLRRQREIMSLTQQELSDRSGVPLRAIRSYEQGQRSLEKASASVILNLSRVLSCRPEDLLDTIIYA